VSCTTQWMQRDTTSYLENKTRKGLLVIRWLVPKVLHTTRIIAQIYLGAVFDVASVRPIWFVLFDLTASKLSFSFELWHAGY